MSQMTFQPTLAGSVARGSSRQRKVSVSTLMGYLPRLAVRVVVWVVILATLVPYIFMVTTSLKPDTFPVAIPPKWIFQPTLSHYADVFGSQATSGATALGSLMVHSAIVALAATVLTIALSLPAAYALARIRFRGRRFLALWILSTIMSPPVVAAIPIFVLAGQLKLMDTYPVLVIPYVAGNIPAAIWILRSTILQVPVEIEEAAFVDGASRINIITRIVIPLAASGIATCAVLILIACWNEFLFAVSLTRSDVVTAPVGVMMYNGQFGTDWGSITAAASVVVLPILVMVLVLRRRFVSGLTFGAVK